MSSPASDARRRPLGSTSLRVGIGLVVFGASSYGFLVLSSRALDDVQFASLSVLWTLVYVVGPGLFVALEQQLARSTARAQGGSALPRSLLADGGRAAVPLLALGTAAATVTLPLTWHRFFGGDVRLVAVFLVSLVACALTYVLRGIAGGQGRFGRYSAQLVVEGLLRLVLVGALMAAGAGTAWWYAAVVPAAMFGSLVVLRPRPAERRGDPSAHTPTRDLGWLVTAALAAQTLANVAPVAVRSLGDEADATAGAVLTALVLARVPIFLFAALQAVLLPAMAAALSLQDVPGFRRALTRSLATVTLISAAGAVGATIAGPSVLGTLVGLDLRLGRVDLLLLSLSTALVLVGLVLQPALLVTGRARDNAVAWCAGVAAFLLCCAVPGDPVRRVEEALLVGGVVTAAALALATVRMLRDVRLPAEPGVLVAQERLL